MWNHAGLTSNLTSCALITIFLVGCATMDNRTGVPAALMAEAQISGVEHVRMWGDAPFPNPQREYADRLRQIRKNRPQLLNRTRHTIHMLALSGGGSDGAFGAGFLNGWTASGRRPEFEVVSGVSAGALLAPFAFLGPSYDGAAKEVFTQYGTKDLLRKKLIAGVLGGSAISSSEPLAQLIAKHVDRSFMSEVAREHGRGRRLLIGTTNLDAERPVVWDMGRIAERNSDRALALFRKVLLASASIPAVFPPIFINVQSGGENYQEMHVDGGVTDNAFLLPSQFDIKQFKRGRFANWKTRLFIIVNSKTLPTPKTVKATTFGIAGRSVSTLIKQQTQGDVIKLYLRARQNGVDFNVASVPSSFSKTSNEAFDPVYMRALFTVGFNSARRGYDWKKQPAGL